MYNKCIVLRCLLKVIVGDVNFFLNYCGYLEIYDNLREFLVFFRFIICFWNILVVKWRICVIC